MASDTNKILTFQTDGLLHDLGTGPFYIRPTPLVSISRQSLRNELGDFGAKYTITMTGTILDNKDLVTKDGNKLHIDVTEGDEAFSIFNKQRDLKELFTQPDLYVEILNVDGSETPDNVFQVKLNNLDFQEGAYINICRYTAVFTAEYMYDDNEVVHGYDIMANMIESSDDNKTFTGEHPGAPTIVTLRTQFGGLISDLSETWSLEVDESLATTPDNEAVNPDDPFNHIRSARGYVVTRTCTVLGKTYFDPADKETSPAWYEAREFAKKMILTDLAQEYPGYSKDTQFSKGVIGLTDEFGGYNHVRTEEIDKAAGLVTVVDTWLLCDDIAFENYTASVDFAQDSPFVSVTLNGDIKGITSIPASGKFYGGEDGAVVAGEEHPYRNALSKYHKVSKEGEFGFGSDIFKRANSLTEMGLNPQPQSIALNEDKFQGTISYSLTFDNRPQNIIKEALVENITINDTYPGDLYALIPVIGRPEGPVLQYIGGRTEYRRELSIELFFDYTDLSYIEGDSRTRLILSKPSINKEVKDKLRNLIKDCSPLEEPNIRKCFVNPATENWNPKEGRYNVSISWVYEIGEPLASISEQNSIPLPGQNNYTGDVNVSPGASSTA